MELIKDRQGSEARAHKKFKADGVTMITLSMNHMEYSTWGSQSKNGELLGGERCS
jgi:hypothetical protein